MAEDLRVRVREIRGVSSVGSRAICFQTPGFASPPHDGFALATRVSRRIKRLAGAQRGVVGRLSEVARYAARDERGTASGGRTGALIVPRRRFEDALRA